METFFGHPYETYPFIMFSIDHITMIIVFLFITCFLYISRKKLAMFDKSIRLGMFLGLFILEALYHIWLYKDGYWDISFTLPLQLCSISLILCLILLSTKSNVIFQIVFFIGITGAFMAIITPELFLGFPHFRYFQFFITHMLIIWTCLYFVFTHQYRPTVKGLCWSFLFLNISATIAFFVNKLTEGNYMFLAYKPTNGSLLDYFGPYPYYILSLEAAALLLFIIILLPFHLKELIRKKRQKRNQE